MTDWKTVQLGEVCTLQRGLDLPKRLRHDGEFPLVTASGIDGTHSVGPVKGPGVMTGRYGTIGKVFFVEPDFWPLNTTLYVRDFHGNDVRFVHHLLQTVDFQSHSGKSGVPGVNRNDVHQEFVHIPARRSEQEAIARALLDADALIDSLEQLLTKKRQIKQGAMQELLTGKRRLLQGDEAWRQAPLGSLGKWSGGMTPSMARVDYWSPAGVPWPSSGDLKMAQLSESAKYLSKTAVRDGATTVVPANSVVMVVRSGILRKYLPVGITLKPMAINQDLKAIQPNTEIAAEFLLHALEYWGERILATCLKTGTTVESLELRWLKAFTIELPSVSEQAAIEDVLSEMNAEITALESRLTKARALKQAMAQALLTGRIRLVPGGVV
jgi:type I restriction enzyme, S subunit